MSATTLEREQAKFDYREVRAAWALAFERADAAFVRWFEKRRNGEPTNAARASYLANEANYRSVDLANAQGALYRLGLDPWDIDDEDGVERTPIGT